MNIIIFPKRIISFLFFFRFSLREFFDPRHTGDACENQNWKKNYFNKYPLESFEYIYSHPLLVSSEYRIYRNIFFLAIRKQSISVDICIDVHSTRNTSIARCYSGLTFQPRKNRVTTIPNAQYTDKLDSKVLRDACIWLPDFQFTFKHRLYREPSMHSRAINRKNCFQTFQCELSLRNFNRIDIANLLTFEQISFLILFPNKNITR